MQFITPTNDPFARIGFAETFGELPDEFGYAAAPQYEADFSEFLCGRRCRERRAAKLAQRLDTKSAKAEETRSKAELNKAMAQSLLMPEGSKTGTYVLIGLGVLALAGVAYWAIKRKK